MKKIVILSLVALLSCGANAFATTSAALSSAAASGAGATIFGGADADTAAATQNRLVSFSKGVQGAVTFSPDTTTKTTPDYVIVTKHTSGTKVSGTSNDSTKLYWLQSATGVLETGIPTDDTGAAAFAVGKGWTEY